MCKLCVCACVHARAWSFSVNQWGKAYSREIKIRRSNDVPLRSGVLRLTNPEVPWALGSAEFSLVWAWSIPIGALALLGPWRAVPGPLSEASR